MIIAVPDSGPGVPNSTQAFSIFIYTYRYNDQSEILLTFEILRCVSFQITKLILMLPAFSVSILNKLSIKPVGQIYLYRGIFSDSYPSLYKLFSAPTQLANKTIEQSF